MNTFGMNCHADFEPHCPASVPDLTRALVSEWETIPSAMFSGKPSQKSVSSNTTNRGLDSL